MSESKAGGVAKAAKGDLRPAIYELVSGGVAVVVVLGTVAWWSIAGLDLGTGVGLVGASISATGVMIAVLIFINQNRSANAHTVRILSAIDEVVMAQARADEATASTDLYTTETAVLDRLGMDVGDGVKRLQAGDIPLKLVRDLVIGWEKRGSAGAWTVGSLVSAFRRTGKGNHAWWIVFRHPNGDEHAVRVARGGKGNSDPDDITVTDAA